MVSALHSGVSAVSLSPHRGHCAVFSGKTFYSQGGSLHFDFNAEGHPMMDWHPIQGEVEIFLVTSCYRNRDRLWPDGPLGSYAGFSLGGKYYVTLWAK